MPVYHHHHHHYYYYYYTTTTSPSLPLCYSTNTTNEQWEFSIVISFNCSCCSGLLSLMWCCDGRFGVCVCALTSICFYFYRLISYLFLFYGFVSVRALCTHSAIVHSASAGLCLLRNVCTVLTFCLLVCPPVCFVHETMFFYRVPLLIHGTSSVYSRPTVCRLFLPSLLQKCGTHKNSFPQASYCILFYDWITRL